MKKIRGILFGKYRMKYIHILLIIILGALVMGSSQETSKKGLYSKGSKTRRAKLNKFTNNMDAKFLITNDSAGYFKIGKPWQKNAKEVYNYAYKERNQCGYEACCSGGFELIKTDVDKKLEKESSPDIIIIPKTFSNNREKNAFKNNPDVFFVESGFDGECSSWYFKDKVGGIIILSDAFKTKDGIGVGTRLQDILKVYGAIELIGCSGGDPEADNSNEFLFKIPSYPGLEFVLDEGDNICNVGELDSYNKSSNFSHLKNRKIIKITVYGKDPFGRTR